MMLFILDINMAGTYERRWLTVVADGTLGEIKEKIRGVQMVTGGGYTVSELVTTLANDNFTLKAPIVALVVGNQQLQAGKNVNMAKQIERLIQQIWIVKPITQIYVSSLIPKPTQETVTQAVLIKANEGIGKMCRRLSKYGQNIVKYMPLHLEFLEKWRHVDEVTGKRLNTTRIRQPHSESFLLGSDQPNEAGAERLLDALVRFIKEDQQEKLPLPDRAGLRIQIDNGLISERRERKWKDGQEKVESAQGKKPKKSKVLVESSREDLVHNLELEKGTKEKETVAKGGSVAQMVSKWEQLSQGPLALDDIDLELGEESIIPVQLGDLEDEDEQQ